MDFSTYVTRAFLACLLFAVASLGTFLLFQGKMINHDTAWYLVAVERWLDGRALYRDILEVNPPLNFYYTLPASWLSNGLGLSLSDAQYAVTSMLTGGVLAWCYLIVAHDGRVGSIAKFAFILMIWVALVVPALGNFAQRDHLLLLFLMPWAVALIFQEDGAYGRSGATRGAFAALGICLKPYFLVFPIFATVALMLRERSLLPIFAASNIAIGLVGALYVGFVWLVHPAYLTEIVPIGVLTYGDYGLSNGDVVRNIDPRLMLCVLLLLVVCLIQRFKMKGMGIITALCLAGLLSYFAQWTGYTYQAVPAHGFGFLLCAYLAVFSSTKTIARSAAIFLLAMLGLSGLRDFYYSPLVADLSAKLEETEKVESISIISSHVYLGPIVALEMDVAWENRYPALWPVVGLVNAKAEGDCILSEQDCAFLKELAVETRQNVLDDLEQGRPDVIIFDTIPGYFDEEGFSFEDFLRKSDDLSKLLDGYARRETIGRFDILYLR